MPIYVFNSKIFDALLEIKIGIGDELQLTDAIQKIISSGGDVKITQNGKSVVIDNLSVLISYGY